MFSNGRSLILLMPELEKNDLMLLSKLIKESIYLNLLHTRHSSGSDWKAPRVSEGNVGWKEVGHGSWNNLTAAGVPSPAPLSAAARLTVSSSLSLHQSAPDLPPKQTHWLASLATRGPSERLAHKCQSRFCFPALHYSADTVPHFVSTVKPLGATSLRPPVRSQTAPCTAVIDTSIFRCPSFRN